MSEYNPTIQVTIFIILFLTIYSGLLLIRVVRSQIDLYDFFMLETLGVIPLLFVIFPRPVRFLCHVLGVELPLSVLFGALSLVTFLMIYRLIRRANRSRREVVRLIQEVGILKAEVRSLRRENS